MDENATPTSAPPTATQQSSSTWPDWDDVPDGKSAMAVMSPAKGDTKIIWAKDNADEVENARRTFNDLRKKGYAAYSVKGKDGAKGEVVREFDPTAERLILAPQMVGG